MVFQFWIVLMVVPFIALVPDMTVLFLKKVYYMSPSDSIVLQMKHESSVYGNQSSVSSKRLAKLPKEDLDEKKSRSNKKNGQD